MSRDFQSAQRWNSNREPMPTREKEYETDLFHLHASNSGACASFLEAPRTATRYLCYGYRVRERESLRRRAQAQHHEGLRCQMRGILSAKLFFAITFQGWLCLRA